MNVITVEVESRAVVFAARKLLDTLKGCRVQDIQAIRQPLKRLMLEILTTHTDISMLEGGDGARVLSAEVLNRVFAAGARVWEAIVQGVQVEEDALTHLENRLVELIGAYRS